MDQVAHIIELVKKIAGPDVVHDLRKKNLIVVPDGTGVGRGVLDLLWSEMRKEIRGTGIKITPCNVTITGGSTLTRNP